MISPMNDSITQTFM